MWEYIISTDFVEVLSVLFILATFIQLFFWIIVFGRLARYQVPESQANVEQPVSVVICAKNEAENLKKNLPHILNQNYHSFEVVVVNDNSTDQTQKVLLEFQKKCSILHIVRRSESLSHQVGKKFALAEGIQKAKHKVLLLTDADCKPSSPEWLRLMQAEFTNSTSIVLGYSPYNRESGFLNRFIRYETFWTAIQYLSFALWGHPYMGVGRNLAYKKSLFYKAGGFKSHEHIASGDDDLFINAIAHLNNTSIHLNQQSFVYSVPTHTWKAYARQKSRHLSTSTSYQTKHQVLLGLLSASHFGHYFFGIILIFLGYYPLVIGGYLLRMSITLLVSRNVLVKLNEYSLWSWIPLMDLAMVVYYTLFAPILLWGTKNRW